MQSLKCFFNHYIDSLFSNQVEKECIEAIADNEEPRRARFVLAFTFATLGGWCLLHPKSVLNVGVRPQYLPPAGPLFQSSELLMRCFGAQAVLNAVFLTSVVETKRTYAAYGTALLPFFAFNYMGLDILTELMALDFVGNLTMLGACFIGWRDIHSLKKYKRTV
eukprot:TRINITY_DN6215_c0_g1_i1.p1 TRINITY_DN6215_c0_g1~~TRINITY_DN6215_c0_g1_i1.p1  ORF type:complete len:164 (-),score=11.49 TRINITY_DN6215_c0_g1_i1:13-504(-)